MIEVAESNAAYYYHFDGLGSVVALSDSSGDTVQTYQYSVYGQVAVEDIDHPNPYMFAGVRYDIEIGLYYNRARYYNPYTGRFMQTDPIGYGNGINWYSYCGNDPVNRLDPSGLYYTFLDTDHPDAVKGKLTWAWIDDSNKKTTVIGTYDNIEKWCSVSEAERFTFDKRPMVGWSLSQNVIDNLDDGIVQDHIWLFERFQALYYLGVWSFTCLEGENVTFEINNRTISDKGNYYLNGVVSWNPKITHLNVARNWNNFGDSLVGLAHEMAHAVDFICQPGIFAGMTPEEARRASEINAMAVENNARYAFFKKVPGHSGLWPRADYDGSEPDVGLAWWNRSWWGADDAWKKYWRGYTLVY